MTIDIRLSWVGPVWGRTPHASSGEQWGVWLYDEPWYDLSRADWDSMRSYKFVLHAVPENAFTDLPGFDIGRFDLGAYKRYGDTHEEVHFVATLILSSFLIGKNNQDIDLDRIMGIYCPQLYREAAERLERRIFDIAPEPTIIEGVGWYCDGREFLEYTPKDAYLLGGPIEFNGREGAMATILDALDYSSNHDAYPWRVYVAGNDDFSWSKYFSTNEDAEAELRYLRMMQPLRHKQDILWRGYEFTN